MSHPGVYIKCKLFGCDNPSEHFYAKRLKSSQLEFNQITSRCMKHSGIDHIPAASFNEISFEEYLVSEVMNQ